MKLSLLICTVFVVLAPIAGLRAADPKPNIIWIYTDDHAVQALSAYGGKLAGIAPTPAIDRLATEGMQNSNLKSKDSVKIIQFCGARVQKLRGDT